MRWEYEVRFLGKPKRGKAKIRLDEMGEGGWELVAVLEWWGFFKRSVPLSLKKSFEMWGNALVTPQDLLEE